MIPPQQAISERVLLLRKRKGMSQGEIANWCRCSQDTVSRWENGRGTPSSEELARLADLFEVSADYLIGRQEATNGLPVGMFIIDAERAEQPAEGEDWAWHIKATDRIVDYPEMREILQNGCRKLRGGS